MLRPAANASRSAAAWVLIARDFSWEGKAGKALAEPTDHELERHDCRRRSRRRVCRFLWPHARDRGGVVRATDRGVACGRVVWAVRVGRATGALRKPAPVC